MSANAAAQENTRGECCCIQRLLLVHLTLEEIATGKGFDECASEQELAEQILYFYSSSSSTSSSSPYQQQQQDNNSDDSSFGTSNSNIAEAIRFVGICSALYTLPTAIDYDCSEETQDDRSTEVYLENCTLVFEPLEGNPFILLVAQIARKHSSSPGATPASVKAALRRTHLLFALLRGGGIHERLQLRILPALENNGAPLSSCLYPGMDQLYSLRKQARKLQERSSRQRRTAAAQANEKSDSDPTAATEDLSSSLTSSDLDLVKQKIAALQEILPIRPLRTDLALHYDAFLDEFNTLAAFNLGAACSAIVECLPSPIPLLESPPRDTSTMQQLASLLEYGRPFVIATSVLTSLSGAMKGYLNQGENEPSSSPCWSQVLAVSLFVRGQLAWTEHAPAAFRRPRTSLTMISNETACLLMWYMASMRQKMNAIHKSKVSGSSLPSQTSKNSINTKLKRSLVRPFGLSFGDHPPDVSAATVPSDDALLSWSRAKEGKGFLPPPLLSMLSVADGLNGFRGPLGEKGLVWAPPAHLPTRALDHQQQHHEDSDVPSHTVRSRICLYEYGDLNFLIYLDVYGDHDDTAYQALLTAFAKAADRAVTLALPGNKLGHPVRIDSKTWKEPGQDIIFVDRQTFQIVVHASTTARNKTSSKPPVATKKTHDRQTSGTYCSSIADLDTSSLPGFDCRHYLASHFRLDSLLAFADAMNEIAQRGLTTNSESNDTDGLFEMCSSLPQGWMLAMAVGQRELYILFDSSLYVTINDVQNAAARIRNEFLHGAI